MLNRWKMLTQISKAVKVDNAENVENIKSHNRQKIVDIMKHVPLVQCESTLVGMVVVCRSGSHLNFLLLQQTETNGDTRVTDRGNIFSSKSTGCRFYDLHLQKQREDRRHRYRLYHQQWQCNGCLPRTCGRLLADEKKSHNTIIVKLEAVTRPEFR